MKKREIENVVSELVENIVAQREDLELADVEYVKEGQDWVLRVFIDRPEGVTLDDCEWVSRRLDPLLDEVDPIPGSYQLEVSSPGAERPLKKEADFDRFAGSLVNVTTFAPVEGRKKWQGRLRGREGDQVVIETKEGELRIPHDQIAKARLAIEF